MKRAWKIIKKCLKWSFYFLIVTTGLIVIFINSSPEFGGDPSKEDQARYSKTGHYENGEFKNIHVTKMDYTLEQILEVTSDYFSDDIQNIPKRPLKIMSLDSLQLEQSKHQNSIVWFGHSAFLLQLDGKNILFDPMFGDVPSPVDFMAQPRFFKELPLSIEQLPVIDFVFISHDHYDHLDYESINRLKDKTTHFILPIGVGAHFEEWEVEATKIHEYNWWDEDEIDGLHFAFTPSRHFSGRGIFNQNSTLWGSWVIRGKGKKIFFSGDGGYDDHFRQIGQKFGPFDLALMECGQYNKYWKNIHMLPEESARAIQDVNADIGIPIHWGAFSLSTHDWFEPPVRIKHAGDSLGVKIITPQIGEPVNLDSVTVGYKNWWSPFK